MNSPHHPPAPRPGLWARLRAAWAALLGNSPGAAAPARHSSRVHSAHAELVDTAPSPLEPQASQPQRDVVPYNPQALPAAREQWQRGDWASLTSLTLDQLQDHPDRAKLALLAGAGHMQLSNNDLASDFVRQAKAWGVNETLIRKTLLANVHAQLAHCWEIAGDTQAANTNLLAAQQLVSLRGLKNKKLRS